ncbi:MAG: hypothetical protein V1929_02050 [bacterium]
MGALLGLPLAGVGMAGHDLRPYMAFPPITTSVQHAAFWWLAFLVMSAAMALACWPFLRHALASRGTNAPRRSVPFPWWGWCGILFGVLAWVAAWTRLSVLAPVQQHTFTFLWLAYIVVVNAIAFARSGRSMMTHDTAYFLALFPASAVFWWFFEYLNRFVQNWSYEGIESFTPAQYIVFATLSFSTVLPAVLGTRDALLPAMRNFERFAVVRASGGRAPSLALLGIAVVGLFGMGLFPDALFPLVWIAPGLIIVAIQGLAGEDTIFAPLRRGDWSHLVAAACAALVCGLFWELWNFHSLAKWVYHVPFVDRFHLFEMPALGFAGYLPFGLECLVIGEAVRRFTNGRLRPEAVNEDGNPTIISFPISSRALCRAMRLLERQKYEQAGV